MSLSFPSSSADGAGLFPFPLLMRHKGQFTAPALVTGRNNILGSLILLFIIPLPPRITIRPRRIDRMRIDRRIRSVYRFVLLDLRQESAIRGDAVTSVLDSLQGVLPGERIALHDKHHYESGGEADSA